MKNYIDNKLILLIALPFIAAFALGFIAESSLKFEPAFHPGEKELLTFSPETLEIKQRDLISVKKSLKSPIVMLAAVNTQNARKDKASPVSLKPKPTGILQKVSFILIKDNEKKIAIIDGLVLNEGEEIGNALIIRIESKRVLIKEGKMKARWLELG